MKNLLLIILLIPTISLAAEDLSHITGAGGAIYFADDFEDGAQYRTSGTRYDGSYGWWSWLGRTSSGTPYYDDPGPGCPNLGESTWVASNHSTVISTDAAALGAVPNSTGAMKTPYWGNCTSGEGFTRSHSKILTGIAMTDYYIRWYQKFTGNWMNASTQHKMFKQIATIGGSGGLRFGSPNTPSWKTWVPNNHVNATDLRWPGKTHMYG